MEFLRALGLSLGWISHVQQHMPSPAFGKAVCLADCPGLPVQRLPGCPAQPPWSSGSSGWWHLLEGDDSPPHMHTCGAAPWAKPGQRVFPLRPALFLKLPTLSPLRPCSDFSPGKITFSLRKKF